MQPIKYTLFDGDSIIPVFVKICGFYTIGLDKSTPGQITLEINPDDAPEIVEMLYNVGPGFFPEEKEGAAIAAAELDQMLRVRSFEAHGVYAVSNAGGYEVEISVDGQQARVKDAFGSDRPQVSEWLDIVCVPYCGDDEDQDLDIIDPHGFNIPLALVERISR